jgi:endonuclease YncB( thermonuclease family)
LVKTFGLDKYGRTIADVLLPDGTDVNHALVKEGWCWWYRKCAPRDTKLEGLEKDAREAKKGLWADPHPVPPWEWREKGAVDAAERVEIMGYQKGGELLLIEMWCQSRDLISFQPLQY